MELATIVLSLLALYIVFSSFLTVNQGTVVVLTWFGKYSRILKPGLNFKIPIVEQVFARISTQNRSVELQFQAVTSDQANVHFKAMLLYAVLNADEETIKNVAFKFYDDRSFMQALARSIEGSIRSFVATKKQSEILSLRREITEAVKGNMDHHLEEWGYHLIDLQVNDVTFDDEVMRSMSKVVAANNLKAAAENEGQALLITKTKAAEAEGNTIRIQAEAEMQAAVLRGQAVARFREEVAKGFSAAASEMHKSNLDSSYILFSMWTEAMKAIAENSQGNMLFFDASVDGMQRDLRKLMAMNAKDGMLDQPQGAIRQ
ncbi:MAG: SPFH domain-containing protein [Bdellovibrionales bacterium]|nr:SPFH domain-containing protein [Bdellovibrionales bacterium]